MQYATSFNALHLILAQMGGNPWHRDHHMAVMSLAAARELRHPDHSRQQFPDPGRAG
jgi:hypothetical protein